MRACVFTLGEAAFALDVAVVREVAMFEDITRIPLAPSHVLGVANLRGDLVPVVDPGAFLGAGDRQRGRKLRTLVVATEAGDTALVVDEVVGLDTLDALSAIPAVSGEAAGKWMIARERREGAPITVLDARAVVTALRPDTGRDH
jgi:chemotaxis signal transduction protein